MPERPLAVITGASSGIGAEFARQLAARGYDLLLTARREDRLRELAARLETEHGVHVECIPADLAADADRSRLAETLRTAPGLAVLVNNAGFGTMGFFTETDLGGQEQMHRLHVLATLELSHAALHNFSARGAAPGNAIGAGIINVASVASFGQSPSNVSYCATKAWMASFTNGLATELAMRGSRVRMQALCPGFTYSEFHDVVRMDRRAVPKFLWMTAEFVVAESLRGFERGQVFVIPGWHYKVLVRLMKSIPDSWLRWFSIRIAHRRRKAQLDGNSDK